jgi:pyrroloquinoline quinone biosynthesis protein B
VAAARGADVVFFDGTFWSEHELAPLGVTRGAREMGHWPIGGEGGSLELLGALPAPRRLYIHVNNTNPIWWPRSPERAAVEAAGVEVARDGQEIQL